MVGLADSLMVAGRLSAVSLTGPLIRQSASAVMILVILSVLLVPTRAYQAVL